MEKILFISENIPDSTKELLCTKGFSVRKLRKESSLPDAVSSHADMLIFSSSKALITAKNYYNSNKDIFEGSRVKCSNDTFGNVYPRDIIFNAFEINNTLFGKTDSLSSDVIKLYKKKVY
ncbi:MAG: hypothetical protein IKU52_04145, partial [Clostridia bacterium]|nr:hypothetical protein [Clostridia bacterium]